MNDRINNWHKEIDKITDLFVDSFFNLDDKKMNWKTNQKSWSISEVIQHLISTNSAYFLLPQKINDPNFKPSILTKISFIPKIFGNLILKSVSPESKRKVKTMGVFEPTQSQIKTNVLEDFKKSQSELHNFIEKNEKSISARMVIPSPINKHFVYHFDTVIDILVNHQKRHFNQAKNVKNLISQLGNNV